MADPLSHETRIKGGVPRGSVIGPLLFLLFLKGNQCDNAAFRRWHQDGLTTLPKRLFAGLPLQCLELVGKLGPPYQSHQMQLHRYWTGLSISIISYHWKSIPYRSQTLLKTWASYRLLILTLYPLQRSCLQSKTDAVYDKAVVRWTLRVHVCRSL